jgi:hypothetical protein
VPATSASAATEIIKRLDIEPHVFLLRHCRADNERRFELFRNFFGSSAFVC